jgi:hypothetical protein
MTRRPATANDAELNPPAIHPPSRRPVHSSAREYDQPSRFVRAAFPPLLPSSIPAIIGFTAASYSTARYSSAVTPLCSFIRAFDLS